MLCLCKMMQKRTILVSQLRVPSVNNEGVQVQESLLYVPKGQFVAQPIDMEGRGFMVRK